MVPIEIESRRSGGGRSPCLARLVPEHAPDGDADGEQDGGERQAARQGCRLQGREPAASEQHGGDDAEGDGPEDPLRRRRAFPPAGCDEVEHQRAGVGGGDEEGDHDDDRSEAGHRCKRQQFEQEERRLRHAFAGGFGEPAVAEHLEVQRRIAEDGEPDEGQQGWCQEHAQDEFPHRAPA